MSLTVLALVVAAAVAHASWNLVAKPAVGGAAFVWLCAMAGTAALSPVVYYWGTNLANAGVLTPVALRHRQGLRQAWTVSRARGLGVGLLSPLAYVLVLYALARAPVSYVAPARESSIVSAPCSASSSSMSRTRHDASPPRRPSSSASSSSALPGSSPVTRWD